ncbi:MAG: ADOP family duplicated permease [Longimicrobiales bacterium]
MGREWWHRFAALFGLRREEADLDEEIRFHLEMEAGKLEAEGRSPGDARREALRRFGGVERMKERTRDERGTRLLEDTVRDVLYTLRTLRRDPAFAVVAVLTLSLGVGATTAMYTLVDGVLLRPLPYPAAHELVSIRERTAEGGTLATSYLNFMDWRTASDRIAAMAAHTPTRPTTVLTPSGGVRARITSVTRDFFQVGGVEPIRGRIPDPGEHAEGGPAVAVVSERFWRSTLGEQGPQGLSLDIAGTVHDVVGVMPGGFELPGRPDVWVALDRAVPWSARGNHVVEVLGRLAPGATVDEADRELDAVQAAIRAGAPEVDSPSVAARPYLDAVVGDARRALTLLLAAAALLLLVACTNLASTLLARGFGRVRELGMRASLGAGRGRLVRQLFLESLTLALAGGMGGVLTASGLLALTRAFDPGAVPRLAEVSLDPGVLGFTLLVAVGTAVAFGLMPALALTRGDLASALRSGRSGHGRGVRRIWRAILAGEVALAVLLLVAGGLVARDLVAILDRPGGFRTAGVVTAQMELPAGKYASVAEALQVVDGILDGVRAGGGVEAVGLTLTLPVPGRGSVAGPVQMDDGTRTDRSFEYRVADAGYFRTLEVPLIRGRMFEPSDGPGAPHAALVDEAMAEALWPGLDPVGQTFNPRGMDPFPDQALTVVGVVGETLRWDRAPGGSPGYYVHYRQRPTFLGLFGMSVVAAVDDTGAGAAHLRETVRRVDRDVPVRLGTLEADIAGSASDRRFRAFVLSGFALAALLLACVGVYGVVAYTAARHTRDMGIRLALGASRSQVRSGVQADVLTTVGIGMAVGSVLAYTLARALERLLFVVSPWDPVAFSLALGALGAAAWCASWVPAWRGTRLSPARVLTEE